MRLAIGRHREAGADPIDALWEEAPSQERRGWLLFGAALPPPLTNKDARERKRGLVLPVAATIVTGLALAAVIGLAQVPMVPDPDNYGCPITDPSWSWLLIASALLFVGAGLAVPVAITLETRYARRLAAGGQKRVGIDVIRLQLVTLAVLLMLITTTVAAADFYKVVVKNVLCGPYPL